MKFTTYTDKGGLIINEDFASSVHKNGIYCFAVADGFGIGGSGAVASETAVETVLDEFQKNPVLTREALYGYIEEAQRQLLIKKSESAELGEMGTTIAVLMTDGSHALWATSGDTRIYIYKYPRIIEVSEDHSVSFEKFAAGKIEYSDIRNDADTNKLRRALGDRLAWEPDISEVFGINASFSFLICTDGFWNNISETETELCRCFSRTSITWLKRMLKKIAPRLKSGSDNLTATAITMQFSDSF